MAIVCATRMDSLLPSSFCADDMPGAIHGHIGIAIVIDLLTFLDVSTFILKNPPGSLLLLLLL